MAGEVTSTNKNRMQSLVPIFVATSGKYYREIWPETGAAIRYNIQHAREKQELLKTHMRNGEIEFQHMATKSPERNCTNAKEILQRELKQTYPVEDMGDSAK